MKAAYATVPKADPYICLCDVRPGGPPHKTNKH